MIDFKDFKQVHTCRMIHNVPGWSFENLWVTCLSLLALFLKSKNPGLLAMENLLLILQIIERRNEGLCHFLKINFAFKKLLLLQKLLLLHSILETFPQSQPFWVLGKSIISQMPLNLGQRF